MIYTSLLHYNNLLIQINTTLNTEHLQETTTYNKYPEDYGHGT